MHPPTPPLAITLGDACGIGPEIVLKACAELLREAAPPALVVYGDAGLLAREAAALGLAIDVVAIDDPAGARSVSPPAAEASGAQDDASGDSPRARQRGERVRVPVVDCSQLPVDLPRGRVDARAGHAAHEAIVRASRAALAGAVAAVVTAPIHKEAIAAAGVRHPGHTEILAELAGVPDVRMMLVNDELRTILVTIHVPLRAAIDAITREAVRDTIAIADAGLRRLGIAQPRIAVAGLNPHAGEGGLMGREDLDAIAPAIADARAAGIDASGPWPGDTVFMRARGFREFDVVVAMYHDQGLIPIKYLGIDTGVNVTVGLPFVRTSVDHGTAFDIAGRGIADHRSLLAAIETARRLVAPPAPPEPGHDAGHDVVPARTPDPADGPHASRTAP